MATSQIHDPEGSEIAPDLLQKLKQLLHDDPAFAEALRQIGTTEQAAELVHQHGLEISAEALWRLRGTLLEGGRPTWRG